MSSKLPLADIFTFDINRNIEGVIKADDDSHLAQEVKEFVVTKEVAQKLGRQFFDAYNETGGTNGVWISGFYGSGKSHLLKMLSVLLQNEEIKDVPTSKRFAASRPEATADGRDLSNKDAADYLSSNRRTDSLVVRPLAEISGREVGRLKRFQQEVFNEASKYREAKDVAGAFQEVLRGERLEARGFLRQSSDFPFVAQLQPYLTALDQFTDLRYAELFQQLDAVEDALEDLRESVYAPIKAFIGEDGKGNLGQIYRKISQFLKNSRENYRHLPTDLITPLCDLIANEKPYLGGRYEPGQSAV